MARRIVKLRRKRVLHASCVRIHINPKRLWKSPPNSPTDSPNKFPAQWKSGTKRERLKQKKRWWEKGLRGGEDIGPGSMRPSKNGSVGHDTLADFHHWLTDIMIVWGGEGFGCVLFRRKYEITQPKRSEFNKTLIRRRALGYTLRHIHYTYMCMKKKKMFL